MNYAEKLKIADLYLGDKVGMGWDDLGDINSLHDCDTVEDIHEACDERMEESGFPLFNEEGEE